MRLLFFLTSLAGLWPRLALPISLGWKVVSAFDLLFLFSIVAVAAKGGLRSADRRLIAAGVGFVAAFSITLAAHRTEDDLRALAQLTYSVFVVLVVSHVRLGAIGVDFERVILHSFRLALGVAGLVLIAEYALGYSVTKATASAALPPEFHRLGGFTGGSALALFICLAAPFVRTPWAIALGILLPALLTASRSLMGVGVALIARCRLPGERAVVGHRVVRAAAWFAVALSAFVYLAIAPTSSENFHLSLGQGAYVNIHEAALRGFLSSPILGTGAAESDRATGAWAPHSAIFGLAAERGLMGLVGFAGFAREIHRRLKGPRETHLRASAAFLGLLVGGMFVDWLPLKGLWFWLGLMLAACSENPGARESNAV